MLDWLNLDDFQIKVVDFKSSTIWKQTLFILRNWLEEIERDRAISSLSSFVENTEKKNLKVWNKIPQDNSTSKIVALAILSIFSSTYSYELLFSEINFILYDLKSRQTDECSATCTLLKVTNFKRISIKI